MKLNGSLVKSVEFTTKRHEEGQNTDLSFVRKATIHLNTDFDKKHY
jgi:hypothetical protein